MRLSIYSKANVFTPEERAGAVVSLDATAKRIQDGQRGLAQNTARLREMLAKGQDKSYKVTKSKILPAATFSGVFSVRDTEVKLSDKFTEHSGLLTFDIDDIENGNGSVNGIRTVLSLHPNVIMVFTSPSNTGVKVLMPVDPIPKTQDADEHKHVWRVCKAELDEILKHYGLKCDAGDDPTRLCFLAHDPDVYYQPNKPARLWDREAYQRELKEQEQAQKQKAAERKEQRKALENREWKDNEIDKAALDYVDPNLPYNDWLRILILCKKHGFSMHEVDAWSRGGASYQEGDVEKRWDNLPERAQGKEATWGSVVYFAQQGGYQLHKQEQRPKLNKARAPSAENEGFLERNRIEREHATDTFMGNETEDSLHILLVKESTGTGKTHTMLAKSKAHDKRTIMNPPHNELAAQAVEQAHAQGYTNAFHFLGREHNWDKSGIAGIPVRMRKAELFEKNNCIMVDQVEKYTRKRLAPRTYCEHRCGFRDECVHLAQYQGLADRDFIASCTPNLLFDLNMRSFLKKLVAGKPEPIDDDLDIGFTETSSTEAPEVTPFNFAILDDYTVSGLYTDVSFSQIEFKELKHAWQGTPTGDFAKVMMKAFDKKKPKKILKAIRKAYESTAEHHEAIAESLTRHARLGTIAWASRPKASKETERLLAEKEINYVDGGRHFIPVDDEAYKELTEKEIPSINPDLLDTQEIDEQVRIPLAPGTALMRGVPVEELTPVWQKGATPIDLIRILLESIGNDKNAPINRTFRKGDPPVAILSFSIPPQAPVGIIPQMALLSATSQTKDTKTGFKRQSVIFSEHEQTAIDFADGVVVYQYQDARLTSGSVFEYPTDADEKRLLQEDPTGLTPTAAKRIEKLNDWAKRQDGLTAFISYKDFTEHFTEKVDGFDVVSHFDKVSGLNFEGLKFLVVFGYPKVKHEIVMEQARRQFVSDTYPLPKGTYDELTQTAEYESDGITITERRYRDARLERIRHQLSTEKLEQAIGRSRLPRWTDTTTVIFTDAPVSGITSKATLFSAAAFNLAESPSELSDAMQQITDAEDSGDVNAVMDAKGVNQRQAYKDTQSTRAKQKADRDARILELHNAGISQRAIEVAMKDEGYEKVSLGTINSIITAFRNCTRL